MKSEGRILNVDWLLHDSAGTIPVQVGERTEVEDDSLRAVIECIDAGPGLRVYLTDATALKNVTVEPRAERTDPWIGSQTTITGHARIDFLDGARAEADPHKAVLFRAARQAAAYNLTAGTRFRSAGYGLNVERLERLFDGEIPAGLDSLTARNLTASRVVSCRQDRRMRDLARTLFSCELNGPLRLLMLEGAVIQLLALHAAALGRRPSAPAVSLTAREQRKVRDARARLLSDMRHPPSLGALAALVSLDEKKLNAGFRAQFGMTVFETLRNERLEHARIALENERVSLRDVAQRVGYNHVSNFVKAFTARYGVPPRRYLRSH
jgi:AraC-like DNA-binding protein